MSGETEMGVLSDDDLRRCQQIAEFEVDAIRRIAARVSEATGVPFKAIMGVRRDRRTSEARHLVMYVAHREGISYPRIGYAMSRDHTTIMHGVRAEAKRRGEV